MYTKEQVQDVFYHAAAKAFLKDYDYLVANPELDIHKDFACESIHVMVISAALEDDLDVVIDSDDFLKNVSTLESGVDYVYSLCNK